MKFNFKLFLYLAIVYFAVTVFLDQLLDHGLEFSTWFGTAKPIIKWGVSSFLFALVMQHLIRPKANH